MIDLEKIPSSYDEITLEQYKVLSELYLNKEKDNLDIIAYFCNLTKSQLLDEDSTEVIKAIKKLKFLQKGLDLSKVDNKIKINDNLYKINSKEKLKFKEFVDSQTSIEADKYDYATLLAILCRKESESYDDDFIANEFDKRREMFNKLPISKTMPLISFFLLLWMNSETFMEQYLEIIKKEINQSLDNLESLAKNGRGKKHFSKSQMKTLQTLREQVKCI